MKVLGIDPGVERVGWGLVVTENGHSTYQSCGCFKTPKTLSQGERLLLIAKEIDSIINREKPDKAVVERLFFATNKKTALAVAEARGVITLGILQNNVPMLEFTPLEVKMAITGNGAAEKKQVAWVVKNILKLDDSIKSDDALDALALCLMVSK